MRGLEPGWWLWVVFNIPAARHRAVADDLGATGYSGPAPAPDATRFTLYALSVERLDLDENASGTLVSYLSNEAYLSKAQIVGLYG